MSEKGLLTKAQLPEFKAWLKLEGYEVMAPKGDYEVLRWRRKPGKPMPIIFERLNAPEHYTCNNAAAPFVRQWIKESHNA